MADSHEPVYYGDYLGLDRILDAQFPKSEAAGKPAHDEMLFIVVHQAYELWFKQILHELDAVLKDFDAPVIDEPRIGVAVARLRRITEIQKLLIDQLRVLETMTPLDFLEFRDYITPASGFQSFQFRLIEHKSGLPAGQRVRIDEAPFYARLNPRHQKLIQEALTRPTLFTLVERWLERTPFLNFESFDFWKSYGQAVDRMLKSDAAIIQTNPTLTDSQKEAESAALSRTRSAFDAILHSDQYAARREEGHWRFSHKAILSALLILLYRDQPILQMPHHMLELLIEMDENWSIWRYRHMIMVHRMIGMKIGTGGSSGHDYLRKTVERHRAFSDLFQLSTFLIPRSSRPQIPADVARKLGFFHHANV